MRASNPSPAEGSLGAARALALVCVLSLTAAAATLASEADNATVPPTPTEAFGETPTPVPAVTRRTLDAATTEWVAVRVRGRDRGTIEIRREGETMLIPLDRLGELLSIEIAYKHLVTEVQTPLGIKRVPNEALTAVDGMLYIHSDYVEQEILSTVRFDERAYALELAPQWRNVRGPAPPEGPADVEPPRSTLAAFRTQLDHQESGDFSSTQGSVLLGGRLADGTWTVLADDATDDRWEAREYNWYRNDGSSHWLVGRQQVQPVSLLGNFDLAGVQYGWSNDGTTTSPQAFGSGVLFPRRGQSSETVRGEAPAGSFVQLRVDGRVVSSEQVGYDGRFIFDEVRLPTRQVADVEILVFEPSNLQIPMEVRSWRTASSAFLVPDGRIQHTVGLGLAGRFDEGFADRSTDQLPRGLGGYYQWRQGVNRNLTTEATVQHNGESVSGYLGVVTRLAPQWVGSAGAIQGEGATGYNVDLEGYRGRWQFFMRSFNIPRAVGLNDRDGGIIDHRVDINVDVRPQLRLGLMARSRDDGQNDETYALPAITWRPIPQLYFDARPDIFGDYLISSFWRPRDDTRLRYFRSTSSSAEITHDVDDDWQVGWNTQFETVETRHTVFATRRGWGRRGSWFVRAGATESEGEFGYLIGGSAPLLPGIVGRFEYQSLPLTTVDGREEGRWLLNVVSDFRHSGGRVVPANNSGFRQVGGGVVGRVVLDARSRESPAARRINLSGARVRVGEGGRAVTDSHGRFFLGNLEPGVYPVELDPADLPIELTPLRAKLRARVASGAATRVDFVLRLEYGVAGRLIDADGNPRPDTRVEIVDTDGIYFTHAFTDIFGLYRLDAVPPGDYLVQVIEGDFVVARREVTVVDDYLFGQDLKLGEPIERVARISPGDPREKDTTWADF